MRLRTVHSQRLRRRFAESLPVPGPAEVWIVVRPQSPSSYLPPPRTRRGRTRCQHDRSTRCYRPRLLPIPRRQRDLSAQRGRIADTAFGLANDARRARRPAGTSPARSPFAKPRATPAGQNPARIALRRRSAGIGSGRFNLGTPAPGPRRDSCVGQGQSRANRPRWTTGDGTGGEIRGIGATGALASHPSLRSAPALPHWASVDANCCLADRGSACPGRRPAARASPHAPSLLRHASARGRG